MHCSWADYNSLFCWYLGRFLQTTLCVVKWHLLLCPVFSQVKAVPGKEKSGILRYLIIYVSQRNSREEIFLRGDMYSQLFLQLSCAICEFCCFQIMKLKQLFGVQISQKLGQALSNFFQVIFAILQSIKD